MPTKLDRVQVLFQKEVFKKLKLLAKFERRSLSSMVGSLVEDAIASNKYQSLLSKAREDDLKSKVDETKILINDILQPKIAIKEKFNLNQKLKKIDNLLTLISKTSDKDQFKKIK
tara:strand:+ start:91 stop:435 length:345 start_codon:yes stop_codon:yes gene_type:complete